MTVRCAGWEGALDSTSYIIPDGCIVLLQFSFDILVLNCLFCLFCFTEFCFPSQPAHQMVTYWEYYTRCCSNTIRPPDDEHSVARNMQRIAITNVLYNVIVHHTRQDKWIQMELVSTLAKNATKLNTFDIILLQTTRKENNWKTEETLERAVVTLETERIKGCNPWCLRWWWIVHQVGHLPRVIPGCTVSKT